MKPALIIGYGNTLRGDDGLGHALAAMVEAVAPPASVSVMAVHLLMPELADPIHQAGLVIFVDAAVTGEPGSWRCQAIAPAASPGTAVGHHSTPAGLLSFVRAMHGFAPDAWLVTVTGRSFDCSDSLSPEVEATLPAVVDFILGKIAGRRVTSDLISNMG